MLAKLTEIYSLKVLEARSLKSCRAELLPGDLVENFLCLFQLLVTASFPGLVAPSLQYLPWSSNILLLCVTVLCVFLIGTLDIGFKVHPGKPGWTNLEILNLITSARTLFSIKSHYRFQELTWTWLLGRSILLPILIYIYGCAGLSLWHRGFSLQSKDFSICCAQA